jgi:RimJ/RimL family protein N-acetyltransferase
MLDSWQHVSPVLHGSRVTLRELRRSDAVTLLSAISTTEVARFISPPPDTVPGFEQFIAHARQQRAIGKEICFGVLTAGLATPVGVFQVRRIEPQCRTAEWGFALGTEFWGEGLFYAAAPLVIDWVFETVGALRLEARSAITNGRGNNALHKLGAVQEAVLRKSLLRDGEYVDQLLWTLTAERWHAIRPTGKLQVH